MNDPDLDRQMSMVSLGLSFRPNDGAPHVGKESSVGCKTDTPATSSRDHSSSQVVTSSTTSVPRRTASSNQFMTSSTTSAPRRTPSGRARKSFRDSILIPCARCIASNKLFIALTTLLTVYALVGDDIRLLATNKPADFLFDIFTMICLVVFTFEIIISCIGKDDYILGFFMCLDVVSTVTLVLDLSFVTESLIGDGENAEAGDMRSNKTARVGAKAGRVVRVIRLVRILKLYKAISEARAKAKRKKSDSLSYDDWDDVDDMPKEKMNAKETRVGKKLSEMTTRRVIILVLTMLMVMPFMRVQDADNYPPAASYAADEVYSAWEEQFEKPTPDDAQGRYERAILKYMYYHNWFTGRSGSCPSSGDDMRSACSSWFFSHVFWIGLMSTNESQLEPVLNSTRLRPATVSAWNEYAASQRDIYNFGAMPDEVLPAIGGEWSGACKEPKKGIFRQGFSLLGKKIDGQVTYAVPCPSDLRNTEKTKFFPRCVTGERHKHWHFAFYFDTRKYSQSEAAFGICITSFVCVVLCVASVYFSNDANKLVLDPVKRMIEKVEAIRDDPLMAMKMADEEFKVELKTHHRKTKAKQNQNSMKALQERIANCTYSAKSKNEAMETVVLEKTIIKLGSLLALGFGEAGASIIGQNLACSDSAGVNVMIPGTKVESIVCKARINDFSTATEVLQEKVMTFVNQIAEIIHGVVDQFHGAANKNNGDTFLLIWRTSVGDDDRQLQSKFADMSLMALAKILGGVHRAPMLADYRTHPGLQQRLGSDCRVNCSFGLHFGWAIEGAVGSEFKIDASYLSPNVSIAASVEAATKVYEVPILVSQSVVELASDGMADVCRLIDRVVIRGSAKPMGLYSLDLDVSCLVVEEIWAPRKWNPRERFKARQFLEMEKDNKLRDDMAVEFESDQDIMDMRELYTIDFQMMFHMGFQNYTNGEWQVAKHLLSNARAMLRGVDDGPCKALLQFMEAHSASDPDGTLRAPRNWKGVRVYPSRVELGCTL